MMICSYSCSNKSCKRAIQHSVGIWLLLKPLHGISSHAFDYPYVNNVSNKEILLQCLTASDCAWAEHSVCQFHQSINIHLKYGQTQLNIAKTLELQLIRKAKTFIANENIRFLSVQLPKNGMVVGQLLLRIYWIFPWVLHSRAWTYGCGWSTLVQCIRISCFGCT